MANEKDKEKYSFLDRLTGMFNPVAAATAQPQNAAQGQQARVRDYISNYGKQYGIKDADIGYRGSGEVGTPGTVTLGGYDLIRPTRIDEQDRSWADEGQLRSAIDQYAAQRGIKRSVTEAPFQSDYSSRIDEMYNQILTPQKFEYDVDTDPGFQAYKERAEREGKRASESALAGASALTGGRLSSWATSAAAQAEQRAAEDIASRAAEFEDRAYDRYQQDQANKYRILDALRAREGDEYGRFADERGYQYGRERDELADTRYTEERDYTRGRDELADKRYIEERDYNILRDEINDRFKDRQIKVSEKSARTSASRLSWDKQQAELKKAAEEAAKNDKTHIEIGDDLLALEPGEIAGYLAEVNRNVDLTQEQVDNTIKYVKSVQGISKEDSDILEEAIAAMLTSKN